MMNAYNQTRQSVIASRVDKADNAFSRMRGLLGKKSIDRDYGLWITPGNSIHTFFMNFSIDVVFLSKSNQVVKLLQDIQPYRLSKIVWAARSILELSSGAIQKSGTQVGDQVEFRS
jgi:uncharacterized membrane protein (UPF0127 family)